MIARLDLLPIVDDPVAEAIDIANNLPQDWWMCDGRLVQRLDLHMAFRTLVSRRPTR